ncbi:MAG TPA: hypothetical protein VJV96_07875 [Candidatus Angelobacter sp.]|nr:hypothetical protein [Candidatus Angelobacter sp.]
MAKSPSKAAIPAAHPVIFLKEIVFPRIWLCWQWEHTVASAGISSRQAMHRLRFSADGAGPVPSSMFKPQRGLPEQEVILP